MFFTRTLLLSYYCSTYTLRHRLPLAQFPLIRLLVAFLFAFSLPKMIVQDLTITRNDLAFRFFLSFVAVLVAVCVFPSHPSRYCASS